jgi:hypothetical protein
MTAQRFDATELQVDAITGGSPNMVVNMTIQASGPCGDPKSRNQQDPLGILPTGLCYYNIRNIYLKMFFRIIQDYNVRESGNRA